MKRCDDRYSQFPQECQDVTTGRPTEDTEFVLQADDIHVTNVEEVRRTQIARQILFLNLEANHLGVLVPPWNVVNRNGQALALGVRAGDGGKQVGRKRSNATLAWQVVADESDFADFRIAFHEDIPLLSSGPAPVRSFRFSGLRYRREMEWIPQVLQLPVIINRGRPFASQLQSL